MWSTLTQMSSSSSHGGGTPPETMVRCGKVPFLYVAATEPGRSSPRFFREATKAEVSSFEVLSISPRRFKLMFQCDTCKSFVLQPPFTFYVGEEDMEVLLCSTCRVGTTLVETVCFSEEDMVHKLKVSEVG